MTAWNVNGVVIATDKQNRPAIGSLTVRVTKRVPGGKPRPIEWGVWDGETDLGTRYKRFDDALRAAARKQTEVRP